MAPRAAAVAMSREAPPPGEEAALPEGAGGGGGGDDGGGGGGEDGCYLALCARPVHFEKANPVNCVFFDEANKQVGAAPALPQRGPPPSGSRRLWGQRQRQRPAGAGGGPRLCGLCSSLGP